jgi:transposase
MIAPDYGQQFLLPPALEDFVPDNHPVRFLREFVDQLDLAGLGFETQENSEGRPGYAPSLLLKIWLFGYFYRIRSTRQLEIACSDNLPLLWLTGWKKPDHNSLWRFWRDHKSQLRQIFKSTVHVAINTGLVGMTLQALDGTKIASVSSGRTGWSRPDMEKLLNELEKEIVEIEKQIQDAGQPAEGYELPEKLKTKKELEKAVKAGLEALKSKKLKQYHPKEEQTRRMLCDGKNRFGYNAQAVVDSQSGIAVAAEVTRQPNDVGQLKPMAQAAQENLPANAKPLTVADSGYGAGEDLKAAQEAQLDVLCYPIEGMDAAEKKYHASKFHYDAKADTVICPEGQHLKFEVERMLHGKMARIFRCHCKDCPVKGQCTKDKQGRRYAAKTYTEATQEMRRRLNDPEQKKKLRTRGEIVEKYFAWIKQHAGFRRWTVRGLENVQAQWSLVCAAINLKALVKDWQRRMLAVEG